MRTIGVILLCLLFAIGGYFFSESKQGEVIVLSDTIIIKKDTEIIKYKLKPYKEIQVDTVFEFMDDSTCNKKFRDLYMEYAKIKYYKDTFVIDSSMFITNLAISKNNVDSLKVNAKLRSSIIINNTYNEVISKGLYIDGTFSSGNIGIGASYNFSKYSVGIGYNTLNSSPYFKIGYKIY